MNRRLRQLESAPSVMLPEGYPGTWSYGLSPPPGGKPFDLTQVERIQFSLRRSDFGTTASVAASQAAIAIESVTLRF
jgi:hypothetical protein